MSKMFDYISGKSEGREAELEASLEHMGGHLSIEIEENAKLRAENERLHERIRLQADDIMTLGQMVGRCCPRCQEH